MNKNKNEEIESIEETENNLRELTKEDLVELEKSKIARRKKLKNISPRLLAKIKAKKEEMGILIK